jgi:DNA polymerase-4
MIWGVGPKTTEKLAEFGIKTIGDLARRPSADLERWFGEIGRELSLHAQGLDDSPIITEHEAKSISQETTFINDISDDKVLALRLREISSLVGHRLRKADIAGTTVKIKIRWPDFTTLTRQITLPQPTDQDDEIFTNALNLMNKVRAKGKAVRLIGVGVSGLGTPLRQMELWGSETEKRRKLQATLDILQEKFGKKMIRRGRK